MDSINAMSDDELHRELRECCGSERWVRFVAGYRPYTDAEALRTTVEAAWQHLEPEDWQQAIAALPHRDLPPADQGTHEALTLALRLYDERFGYPFIAEQEHLPAEELLMRIRIRLGQDPPAELRKTYSEICIIARRRLTRLLLASSP